jgi:uncharacterized protein YjbJ (UPF0337 family)
MDNDRIKGAVKQKVGEVKEAAGKVLDIVGGIKDSVRENQDKR